MAKTTMSIKIDAQVKQSAQQIASELGLSLSGVVNGFLKQFVRTKTIQLSLNNSAIEQFEQLATRGRNFAQQHNITEADILADD